MSLLEPAGTEALSAIAEIAPDKTFELLQCQFGALGAARLKEAKGEARRSLVNALSKIAFHEPTFVEAAWLMLMLAGAEYETWGNNTSGCFEGFFPLFLAAMWTGLAPQARVLDRASPHAHDDPTWSRFQRSALMAQHQPVEADGFPRLPGLYGVGLTTRTSGSTARRRARR